MGLSFQGLNKKDEERKNNLWAGPVPNPCSVHKKKPHKPKNKNKTTPKPPKNEQKNPQRIPTKNPCLLWVD